MSKHAQLAALLRTFYTQSVPVMQGVVKSIEGNTCTVTLSDLDVPDIRLKATTATGNDALLITPKVGTCVLVADLTGELKDLAVISIDAFDKLEYSNGQTKFKIESGGFTIENNNENLYTALSDFIKEVQKIIVVQGTSPDVAALTQINQRLNRILK